MIDLMVRCITRDRWLALAQNRNLMVPMVNDAGVTVYISPSGVDIDEIGNAVITTSPLTVDTWWLVNVRLSGERFSNDVDTLYTGERDDGFRFVKSKLVRFIREQATQVTTPWGGRAYQFGSGTSRVQALDPRDAEHAPRREWLGGMNL
jgi:hypothetical protein